MSPKPLARRMASLRCRKAGIVWARTELAGRLRHDAAVDTRPKEVFGGGPQSPDGAMRGSLGARYVLFLRIAERPDFIAPNLFGGDVAHGFMAMGGASPTCLDRRLRDGVIETPATRLAARMDKPSTGIFGIRTRVCVVSPFIPPIQGQQAIYRAFFSVSSSINALISFSPIPACRSIVAAYLGSCCLFRDKVTRWIDPAFFHISTRFPCFLNA